MGSGSGGSGFPSMTGNSSESPCNNINLPSNSTLGGNDVGPSSMGDTSNLAHSIGGHCKGESDSVSPPPSDYKPSILYGGGSSNIGGQHLKKHLTPKVTSADEHAESDRITNNISSLSRATHGSAATALHPSPDSGVAISDNVSSSGSPNHPVGLSLLAAQGVALNGQSAIAALGTSNSGSLGVSGELIQQTSGSKSSQHNNDGDFSGIATSRPQPVRSPYEWMKRPSFQTRSTGKEGR